jgi:plasmid stabilization system protein ParE
MISVRLSRHAADYLRRETDYLRRRNPAAARNFVDAIKDARRLLQTFPDAGSQAHALQLAGNRVLVVGDYLIEYARGDTHVDITSIRHGRTMIKTPPVDDPHSGDDAYPAIGGSGD